MVATMARRYHLDPLPDAGLADLGGDVAHHLARVMRVRPGDSVTLFDGKGRECAGRVHAVSGQGQRVRVTCDLEAARPATREPDVRVEVAFAAPKGNRAEWVFEHGTEVGIAAFRPLETQRCRRAERSDRWQRILVAATGQCDRGRLPALHETTDLETLVDATDLPDERYVADASGPPLGAAESGSAILVVGPEGGLTKAELGTLAAHGFAPRSLGVTTLRTETAVLVGAARLLA
jgi:16S rRNA (uracil1498-N3)-methyltransferase